MKAKLDTEKLKSNLKKEGLTNYTYEIVIKSLQKYGLPFITEEDGELTINLDSNGS